MSAERVCDMSCGAMHEFALVLDKAGFTATIVQEVINARGNKKAKAMLAALAREQPAVATEPVVPATPCEKFYFVKEIKVTIPKDYDHSTRLNSFDKKNRKKFYGYNDLITDENFARVTTQLVPGKTYTVKIFGITSGEVVTSDECLTKYREEKALLVGAQGASVVWEQQREELPKGKWYASFDEKGNLPVAGGYHRVPYVFAHSYGDFYFDLGGFEVDWDDVDYLLCFCDEQSSEPSPLS